MRVSVEVETESCIFPCATSYKDDAHLGTKSLFWDIQVLKIETNVVKKLMGGNDKIIDNDTQEFIKLNCKSVELKNEKAQKKECKMKKISEEDFGAEWVRTGDSQAGEENNFIEINGSQGEKQHDANETNDIQNDNQEKEKIQNEDKVRENKVVNNIKKKQNRETNVKGDRKLAQHIEESQIENDEKRNKVDATHELNGNKGELIIEDENMERDYAVLKNEHKEGEKTKSGTHVIENTTQQVTFEKQELENSPKKAQKETIEAPMRKKQNKNTNMEIKKEETATLNLHKDISDEIHRNADITINDDKRSLKNNKDQVGNKMNGVVKNRDEGIKTNGEANETKNVRVSKVLFNEETKQGVTNNSRANKSSEQQVAEKNATIGNMDQSLDHNQVQAMNVSNDFATSETNYKSVEEFQNSKSQLTASAQEIQSGLQANIRSLTRGKKETTMNDISETGTNKVKTEQTTLNENNINKSTSNILNIIEGVGESSLQTQKVVSGAQIRKKSSIMMNNGSVRGRKISRDGGYIVFEENIDDNNMQRFQLGAYDLEELIKLGF